MELNYTLTKSITDLINSRNEKVFYCVPFDLDQNGGLIEDAYFVVTRSAIYVIRSGKIIERLEIKDFNDIECENLVHCGSIVITDRNGDRQLLRFSHRYLIQFSYVVKGVQIFKKGEKDLVTSYEPEKECPKCNRILPGTKKCPRCDNKGRFISRMKDMMRPNFRGFLFLTFTVLLSTALVLLARYVERLFIDSVLIPVKGDIKDVLVFFFSVLFINMSVLGLSVFQNKKSASMGTRISKSLRENLYSKLQECDLQFINDKSPGELMNRVHRDTRTIQHFFQTAFSRMFSTILSMIGAIIMMGVMDPVITLIALSTAPVIFFISFISRKAFKRRFRAQWILEDKANNQLQDALSGIRVVKAFGREEYQSEKFYELNSRLAYRQSQNEKFWSTFNPAVGLLLGLTSLTVLFFGGRNVLDGSFSIGQLSQFVGYTAILMGPLTWISMFPRQLIQTITSIERIYDVIDQAEEMTLSDKTKKKKINGEVVYQDVGFGYKSYEPVLENIDLEVKPGEMIGIVGPSGAGKSTLINLLIRLYDPDHGRIVIDGVPLTEIDHDNYHSQIGVVLQETFLFSGSILENIRYARQDASNEEVIKAARIANAHDFITLFPDGYNTRVGDKGAKLSGGERQRIAIARAILSDPAILVLDEATSSLDTETEFRIQEAIYRLTSGRTTFAIAHRLSTLRKSDRIIVIDGRRIAEFGTHNELMEKKGIYYDLVTAQLRMSRVEEDQYIGV